MEIYESPDNEDNRYEHVHAFSLIALEDRFGDVPRRAPVDSNVEVDVSIFIDDMGAQPNRRRRQVAQRLTLSLLDRAQDPDLELVLPAPELKPVSTGTRVLVAARTDREPAPAAAEADDGATANDSDFVEIDVDIGDESCGNRQVAIGWISILLIFCQL